MFDWLFEGWLVVYLLLATCAVIVLALWWQIRNRKHLVGLGLAAALLGAYFLLDVLVETDREKIVRTVREMAAAAKAHNIDGLFEHISDQVRTPQDNDKQFLRELAKQRLDSVQDVKVKDFDILEMDRDRHTITVRFNMSIKAESLPAAAQIPFSYEVRFQLENGRWRMTKIDAFKLTTRDPVPFSF